MSWARPEPASSSARREAMAAPKSGVGVGRSVCRWAVGAQSLTNIKCFRHLALRANRCGGGPGPGQAVSGHLRFSAACGDVRPTVRANAAKVVFTRRVRLHLAAAPEVRARTPSAMRHGDPVHITVVTQTKIARRHGYDTQEAQYTVTSLYAVEHLWRPPHQHSTARTKVRLCLANTNAAYSRHIFVNAVRSHTNSRHSAGGPLLAAHVVLASTKLRRLPPPSSTAARAVANGSLC